MFGLGGLQLTAIAVVVAGLGAGIAQEVRWRGKVAEVHQTYAVAQAASNARMLRASEDQIIKTTEERQRYAKQLSRGRADLRRVLERLRDHAPADADGRPQGGGAAGGPPPAPTSVLVRDGDSLVRLAGKADETARALELGQSTIRSLLRVIEACGPPAKPSN